jgi:hypothetical protein
VASIIIMSTVSAREEEIFEYNGDEGDADSTAEQGRRQLETVKGLLKATLSGANQQSIMTSSIVPEESFAVFNGKLFFPQQREFAANFEHKALESPLQRFARLRTELSELQSELQSVVEVSTINKPLILI